jgi:hypothetical protein
MSEQPDTTTHGPETPGAAEQRTTTRLGALWTLAAGAVGLVGGSALTGATAADAADGANVVLGQGNTQTAKTQITSSGGPQIVNDGAFVVSADNTDWALGGVGNQIGVYGSGGTGVTGVGNVGGAFSGDLTALNLNPQTWSGAPTGGDHLKGDLLVDKDGVLWLCVANGTPGTWVQVSQAGPRYLASPYRVFSSTDPGAGGKFKAGETRDIQIVGSVPGVPAHAVAVLGNVTVHQTVGAGFATAYPAGTSVPSTSNLNWFASDMQIANAINVRLGNGAISVFTNGTPAPGTPACEVIVDVSGYVV